MNDKKIDNKMYKDVEDIPNCHPDLKWFNIWQRLPSYNEVVQANRSGWQAGNRLKKQIESDIVYWIEQAKGRTQCEPVAQPINLHLIWHEPNRKRDVDNVQSSQKFILDAMQKAGIIPNDSPKYVQQIIHSVTYDCSRNNGDGFVGVYLEVLPEDESEA